MKIEEGRRVRIQIKLSIPDGELIEQSVAEYFHGAGTIIPGLEKALEGLAAGEQKSGVIPATEAFSAATDLPTKKIPRREFPADAQLEVDSVFGAKGPGGRDVTFKVLSASDEVVEVQFQHPLAGKDIAYEATVLSVSDPVPPPLPGSDDLLEENDD